MCILSRHNAELILLQRVVHKMTNESEMVNYSYILHVLTQVFINLLEPRVLHIGRAYRYPPNVAFYVFFQQI